VLRLDAESEQILFGCPGHEREPLMEGPTPEVGITAQRALLFYSTPRNSARSAGSAVGESQTIGGKGADAFCRDPGQCGCSNGLGGDGAECWDVGGNADGSTTVTYQATVTVSAPRRRTSPDPGRRRLGSRYDAHCRLQRVPSQPSASKWRVISKPTPRRVLRTTENCDGHGTGDSSPRRSAGSVHGPSDTEALRLRPGLDHRHAGVVCIDTTSLPTTVLWLHALSAWAMHRAIRGHLGTAIRCSSATTGTRSTTSTRPHHRHPGRDAVLRRGHRYCVRQSAFCGLLRQWRHLGQRASPPSRPLAGDHRADHVGGTGTLACFNA